MTTERDLGGPAFPRDWAHDGHNGMTLRDYFAARALASMIAEPVEGIQQCIAFDLSDSDAEAFAQAAYRFADAMLKERAK